MDVATSASLRRPPRVTSRVTASPSCTPATGGGSVENKVGTIRRNLFVPRPQVWDARAYDTRLLEVCLAVSDGKWHHRSGASDAELLADERISSCEELIEAGEAWPEFVSGLELDEEGVR